METIDISEVARRTGVTSRALRFYEARGLVTPLRAASGRRFYGAAELARLNAVIALKRAGFTLAAIARMLSGRSADLGHLVAAQLDEIDARVAELADTRRLLQSVQSRIDRGEPIDVATLCSLIEKGKTMAEEKWGKIADRYVSAEGKADFAASYANMPKDFDQEAYSAQWADLAGRIERALPIDPASPPAQAFLAEWQALLAPFTAIATPAMASGVTDMYDHIDTWKDEQAPPFSADVWALIKAAGASRAG